MSASFEFPGEHYEIIRQDFRNLQTEIDFFASYLPPTGRVLDLGCGTGTNLRALAALGHECVGVDQSRQFIDYAKNAGGFPVDYVCTKAVDYDSDGPFDLVLSIFVTLNYLARSDLPVLFRRYRVGCGQVAGSWLTSVICSTLLIATSHTLLHTIDTVMCLLPAFLTSWS